MPLGASSAGGPSAPVRTSQGRIADRRSAQPVPPAPTDQLAHDLLIEVRVDAGSLQDAANEGLQAAASQLLPLTVAANAFVANPMLVSAYETSPSLSEREWVQRRQPAEEALPPNSREIAADTAGEFMRAVEHHPQRRRFGRVLAFYREALRYAETDSALLAVEFLQITAETLTPVLCELDTPGRKPSGEELGQARLEKIYAGDKELRKRVEHLSNGFEHGFEDLGAAKDVAEPSSAKLGEHSSRDHPRFRCRRACASSTSYPRASASRCRCSTPNISTSANCGSRMVPGSRRARNRSSR